MHFSHVIVFFFLVLRNFCSSSSLPCCLEMVYPLYCKQRILYLRSKGFRAPTIARILKEEEKLPVTRVGVHEFLRRFDQSGCLSRFPGSGRPSKITTEIKQIVEAQMRLDDETTAHQLHSLLKLKGYSLSLKTILRCRSSLGWTFRGSAYCQLIRDVNMQKRLEWALENKDDTFDDVIFTDECTVQMESHRRFCCRKEGEAPRPKPRYIFFIMCFVASFTIFCFFFVCIFLLDPNIPTRSMSGLGSV